MVIEMYITEDLVHDKRTGALIGFNNLGDINTHLLQFQSGLEKDADSTVLSKTMLVFMVRGLFSNLEFTYAQFACTDITGDLYFAPIREAVSRQSSPLQDQLLPQLLTRFQTLMRQMVGIC